MGSLGLMLKYEQEDRNVPGSSEGKSIAQSREGQQQNEKGRKEPQNQERLKRGTGRKKGTCESGATNRKWGAGIWAH